MADETVEFSATQRDAGEGAPGATAAFPYDRMTVERFRAAFPRARWRDDLGAWFVSGKRAERRLTAWMSRAWTGVLAHADQRGRAAARGRSRAPAVLGEAALERQRRAAAACPARSRRPAKATSHAAIATQTKSRGIGKRKS